MSFVFTAKDKKLDNINKKKPKTNMIGSSIFLTYNEQNKWDIFQIIPANDLINSATLRFGSRLNTSCNFNIVEYITRNT